MVGGTFVSATKGTFESDIGGTLDTLLVSSTRNFF
jgi:hypothetical protein